MFIRSTLGEPGSNQTLRLRSPTRRTYEHMIQLQPHEGIIRTSPWGGWPIPRPEASLIANENNPRKKKSSKTKAKSLVKPQTHPTPSIQNT
jgi:hypothetical protein